MHDIVSVEATKGIAKAIGNLLSGPISEMSELIADQIRYFRWKAIIRIAERAKEIRINKGVDAKCIPLKVLLPILEEGSKEEDTSDMCERWAQLLASSDSEYNSFDLVCVDFLKKMSSLDAAVVDALGTYRDPRLFRNKLMEEVFCINPVLRSVIDNCSEKAPNLSEKDRSKYLETVNLCLENDLKYCWSIVDVGDSPTETLSFKSKFAGDHPETVFALKTIGILDHNNLLRFNPDFSSREHGRLTYMNGKWRDTNACYSIDRFSLTQMGELFWRKISGNYTPK